MAGGVAEAAEALHLGTVTLFAMTLSNESSAMLL